MNYFIKISFFVITGMILISCKKELEIDVPNKERKIVVNGVLNPDEPVSINISRSLHILDDIEYDTIKRVTVELYENDNLIGKLINTGNGNHVNDIFFPKAGNNYNIVATAPDFKTINAQFSMPNPVEIISLDSVTSFKNEDNYEINYYYDVEFQDTPNEKNYYALDIFRKYPYPVYYVDTITGEVYDDPSIYDEYNNYIGYRENLEPVYEYQEQVINFQSDEVILDEYGQGVNHAGVLFSDKLIEGKRYKFRFYIISYYGPYYPGVYYDDYLNENKDANYLYVHLSSLSEEFYLYLKSYYHHYTVKSKFGGSWLEEVFDRSEPVPVYTNVTNGYGIFGGYNTSIDSIIDLSHNYYY